jgi:pre-rRNA-processing protein TSR3
LTLGHADWGELVLEGFSWGHAFFEVNGGLLEKYAQCKDAEEVGKVQEEWLARLEKEWVEKRQTGDGEDEWAGGNPNQVARDESDDDDDELEEEEDENQGEGKEDGEDEE